MTAYFQMDLSFLRAHWFYTYRTHGFNSILHSFVFVHVHAIANVCSWPVGSWVASSRYGDLTLKFLNHRVCSINLRLINSNTPSSMLAQGFGSCSCHDLATNRTVSYLMVFGCSGGIQFGSQHGLIGNQARNMRVNASF